MALSVRKFSVLHVSEQRWNHMSTQFSDIWTHPQKRVEADSFSLRDNEKGFCEH